MRFIGNHHALHFGGHTFVNNGTLINYAIKQMIARGKSSAEQEDLTKILTKVVEKVEQELRDELREKHYHHDLHMEANAE